jgi:hypothetical protein
MLIQTLRKQITVVNYSTTKHTVRISYFRSSDTASKSLHLVISPLEYLQELDRLAMIDGIIEGRPVIDDKEMAFEDFIAEYPISQWEALQIAISHELGIEIDEETEMLELDAAINSLK